MASPCQLLPFFSLFIFFSFFSLSESATCTSQAFSDKKVFTFCDDLPALNSYLHWKYDEGESTLSIAFIAPPASPDGWVSWAINPTSTGMVGSQALIAFRDAKGGMNVKTYNVSGYGPLRESKVWYEVKESSAECSDGVIRLFATLVLPEKGVARVNHVWQVGASVTGGVPDKHGFLPENLNSKGSLDLLGGQSHGNNEGDTTSMKKYIHGVLCGISWGILFPIGVIIARYLRVYPSADPAWFYLHVSCQVVGYVVGVVGWGIGLKLGSESMGITHYFHRNVGITLFVLANLQIFALFLRPGKEHKYRVYWNIYHHGCGYILVFLAIVNVFEGLHILSPESKWMIGYYVVIAALGMISLFLEVITLVTVRRRKELSMTMKPLDGL